MCASVCVCVRERAGLWVCLKTRTKEINEDKFDKRTGKLINPIYSLNEIKFRTIPI